MTTYTPKTWANGEAPALSAANIQIIDDGISTAHSELQAHIDIAADAHDASAILNIAAGNIASITVQAAINELDTEKVSKTGGTITSTLIIDPSTDVPALAIIPNTDTATTKFMIQGRNSTNTTDKFTVDNAGNIVTVGKIHNVTLTAPATNATITIADGKTLTVSADASVSGTNTGDNTTAILEVVTDTTSATTYPALYEAATGSIAIHTDAGLTYNATTAALSTTTFVGSLTGHASLDLPLTGGSLSKALSITSPDADNATALSVTQQDTATAVAASITNASTGDGLFITQTGSGVALHIDNNGTANSITVEGTTTTDFTVAKSGAVYATSLTLGTDLAVADGGTGSGTAAAARLALGVVDANDRMPSTMLSSQILNSYWHAVFSEMTIVAGTWEVSANGTQTDFDSLLTAAAGFLISSSAANNDEVNFGSIALNAGTYKVIITNQKDTNRGIVEILHGTTSIGTADCYNATPVFNNVSSFTYSPTTRVSGNLRVKITGKNASSTGYISLTSRLEIIRTG